MHTNKILPYAVGIKNSIFGQELPKLAIVQQYISFGFMIDLTIDGA